MKDGSRLSREQLLGCIELGKALTSELDPNLLLARIMDKVSRLFPSETWSLLLLDENTKTLRFELSIDLDLERVRDVRLPIGEGAAGRCALKQELLILEDVKQYAFFNDQVDEISGYRTESLVCVPIVFAGRTLGVLEIVNPKAMGPSHIALLTLVADYLAIAMENTRRYRKMRNMAIRDSLTGLYNQRYLYRSLRNLVEKCRSGGGSFSLIFMDIDNFKTVVDTEGHLNGSRALGEVARNISACIRDMDFAVAYGGDEFVVVMPDTDRSRAKKIARKIRASVKSASFLTPWDRNVRLTASFGVATFPDDAGDIESLLALADQAMFRVKNTGKDRIA
jgi:diguanylate cyclase (GGDEF)-like protein